MIYPGGRFFRYFDFVHKNSNNDRGRGMTRKDGLLALLVVVVWGLNFVVIKLGLHNMPPLMLAGLRFMLVAFPALLFVARPAIPLRLLLGYGLTISFGQFAFSVLRYRPGYAGRAGLPCAAGASLLHHHPWRLRLWRTSAGQAAGGDRPGDLWRAGAGGGQPWRGACAAGGLYADPRGGAQLGLRQYFQQENHVPGEPAANHVTGGLGAR
ncbi:drug/metabolite transporter permease [Klebsiella pneumoniae]|uniref:Drug/metabolite transporter permease n=1 Tax=Klebsiella pneumoniae TaxID=573 RepID=A0A378F4B1_KLEPN|nr:drug/metabolite transporter permease [Klebsiella pneumoniae]